MGQDTNIAWCDHTFNPWRGCTKISPGCAHCYAEAWSHRNPGVFGVWGPHGVRAVAAPGYWKQPLAWDKAAGLAGERRKVFCASLADVFEDWGGGLSDSKGRPMIVSPDGRWEPLSVDWMPSGWRSLTLDDVRERLLFLIRDTPDLDWLLLTKRPENILETFCRLDACDVAETFPHMWIGVSVEDRAHGLPRVEVLRTIPARVRFLSVEPLLEDLGPIDLTGIHWVIVGGESGPHARPMHPRWVRSIRDQCVAQGVAFFFKQWGEWAPLDQVPGLFHRRTTPGVGEVLRWPFGLDGPGMARIGKKTAGRQLDGREWREFPAAEGVAR